MAVNLEVVRDITTQEPIVLDWLDDLAPCVQVDAKVIMFLVLY